MRIIYIIFLSSIILSGCNNDIHDHQDLVTGKQLFEHHCSECHNSSGLGNFLRSVPANKDTKLSAWQITHKLRAGEKDGKMPIFEEMSVEEAMKISAYLKRI